MDLVVRGVLAPALIPFEAKLDSSAEWQLDVTDLETVQQSTVFAENLARRLPAWPCSKLNTNRNGRISFVTVAASLFPSSIKPSCPG
jgi:hypothetical protein